jgi:hypothetical protein
MIATAVTELSGVVGTRAACAALAVSRATHYRRGRGPRLGPPPPRPSPGRALSPSARTAVLETLHGERFVDASPAATYATLLDEGTYLASERTMYRILAASGEVQTGTIRMIVSVFGLSCAWVRLARLRASRRRPARLRLAPPGQPAAIRGDGAGRESAVRAARHPCAAGSPAGLISQLSPLWTVETFRAARLAPRLEGSDN